MLAFAAVGVVTFVVAFLGTFPPVVTVMSPSMKPTFKPGDVLLMQSLHGRAPRVGEVVEIPVPLAAQRERHYPERVAHRVVKIENGLVYTKGDNVGQRDPFTVPVSAIHRRVLTVVPGAGRMIAFLFSPFGLVWLGGGVLLFFVLPMRDSARERVELEQVQLSAIAALRLDLERLERTLAKQPAPPPAPAPRRRERPLRAR